MKSRIARAIGPAAMVIAVTIALVLLEHELKSYHYRDLMRQVWTLPHTHLALAVMLTAIAYAVLPGYDPTVTINDKVNLGEPTEAGSFAVDEQIRNTPPRVRIALLRGASDKERESDRAFIEAGGARLTYTIIPFASHSLKSLVIAGPMIQHAIDQLVGD